MNGIQSRKTLNAEKPFQGCLGRMVNLFDLSTGVAGNRMLMDRPHHDGSSLARSQSDVSGMSSPFGDKIEDKVIVSDLRRTSSNRKTNGTPMKMLIDQEMSREIESKNEPPNVVAKLMGLDALPRQQPHSSLQRSNTDRCARSTFGHSGMSLGSWQQEGFSDNRMQFDVQQCPERNEYKDVYEVWQQPPNPNYVRDKSPQKERYARTNDRKMALVRQKFMEAKRLATDEKLRQSKEFQEALEVLSSNRDLFLRFLQEPNSLYSQHLYELQSVSAPPEKKRITVLRPSKLVDNEKFSISRQKSDKQIKKPSQVGQGAMWEKNNPIHSPIFPSPIVDECPIQPTRIVVLKPSTGKTHDIRAVVSSPASSPKILHGENIYEDHEDDDARESREMAKEITRHMRDNLMAHQRDETLLPSVFSNGYTGEAQESREMAKEIPRHMRDNLMGHQRDETLLSSVFSNGYTGDESSFNKSENEFAAENLSDSEVMSPSSRHSWDYINRLGSPFSSSSFSRASCSPESSVCREAKKRLSERWAMMASNGNSQEQRHVRRSSSTLGEMLALIDMKKSVRPENESSKEQEIRESVSCSTGDSNKGVCDPPRSLLRSKSVPVSSTVFDNRLNVKADAMGNKTDVPKELTRAKSSKSSLKGKVSSLFFSRSKKSSKERSGPSGSSSESQSVFAETPRSLVPSGEVDTACQCGNESSHEECLPPAPCGSSGKVSRDVTNMGLKQGIVSREQAGLSLTKPAMTGNVSENQDQPSPISVLEPSFEEEDITTHESSAYVKRDLQGGLLRSNLIDKSPPIESIARTLSWDNSCLETATPFSRKPSPVPTVPEEDEQDWLAFVQTLLSAAGLDGDVRCDSCKFVFSRCKSPESPLDLSLREKYANAEDKEPLLESRRRQLRSTRKLVFDFVNAALADISGYGSDRSLRTTCGESHEILMEGDSPLLVDRVWGQMKEWFSAEVRCLWEDCGDANSLVVDRMVRKEVVGRGWTELMRLEIDNLGNEIEGKLMEELIEEAVVELTGRI